MRFRRTPRPGTIRKPVSLRLEALEGREVPSAIPIVKAAAAQAVAVLQVHQGIATAKYRTIQSAVNAAKAGDEIEVFSGTYREAVTVTKADLTIEAAPGATVTIQNPGQLQNGITVESSTKNGTIAGFSLENVTVKGFSNDGVYLMGVTDFQISNVIASNNLVNGFVAVLSSQGSIIDSTAYGSNVGGVAIGQSNNIFLTNEVVYNNTNGIEITNSSQVTTANSTAFDNTIGIVVDQLPGGVVAIPGHTPVLTSSSNIVQLNKVYANNRPNSASGANLASVEPSGTGILIVGGDRTSVSSNDVFSNSYGGIVMISGANMLASSPAGTPKYSSGDNSLPRSSVIQNNDLSLNGYGAAVHGWPKPADLVWTGTGTGNQWSKNIYNTSSPSKIPS